jgi:hypothetical protein
MAEKDTSRILLPIEWHVPDDLVTRYANNLLIQHTEHEFILSFFEILPPLAKRVATHDSRGRSHSGGCCMAINTQYTDGSSGGPDRLDSTPRP